jgi:hypothetical protein
MNLEKLGFDMSVKLQLEIGNYAGNVPLTVDTQFFMTEQFDNSVKFVVII